MVEVAGARRHVVPPGEGRAVRVPAGAHVQVIDLDGGQVGDVFAFVAEPGRRELTEYLSAAHTRASTSRLFPRVGESFVTSRRRDILRLTGDTVGVHDMLIAACDPPRYAQLGADNHRSCAENLTEALCELDLTYSGATPQPVNVFMRIQVSIEGDLQWWEAPSGPGDSVTFQAMQECVVAVSACPQDIVGINRSGLSALAIDLHPQPARTEESTDRDH